ncbi:lysophosphatidic acid receptor 6-like [Genypterus blacodes]|uniref:lysophosphatidic acid receptor 6-like n=1 Tax=Genypterus blacodes TaxID=154954 RepID=UPI003F775B77
MANVTSEENMAYAAVYGSVMVFGLPLNAMSLWILLQRHSLSSSNAVFMVNLALSDLLLVISLPMRVYFFATGNWPLGIYACTFITMLFFNNVRSSTIFITFISVDRLLAVVYPLRSKLLRTPSNAWKATALGWLFVVLVNIPEGKNFYKDLYRCNASTCFSFPNCTVDSTAALYFQCALVVTLLAVNVVSTAMVTWTLHRHLNDSVRLNNKVNVMLIFAMNLIMFIIFFLPLSVVGLLNNVKPALKPTLCLASMNCCLDPLLYYFSLDAFWKKKKEDSDS